MQGVTVEGVLELTFGEIWDSERKSADGFVECETLVANSLRSSSSYFSPDSGLVHAKCVIISVSAII